MTDNVKIITQDVEEIEDIVVLSTNNHPQLDVVVDETYDSVLAKIVARVPTLPERQALDNAVSPSASNRYITASDLADTLLEKIPWKTIGPTGSGADFEGDTDTVFVNAFAGGTRWFLVHAGTYTFANPVTIPADVKVIGMSPSRTIVTGNVVGSLFELSNVVSGGTSPYGSFTYLSYMTVAQTHPTSVAISVQADNANLEYMQVSAIGPSVSAANVTKLRIFDSSLQGGQVFLDTVSDSFIHGCLFDMPSDAGLVLQDCNNVSTTSCIFKTGIYRVKTSLFIKALANHFGSGTDLVTVPTTGSITLGSAVVTGLAPNTTGLVPGMLVVASNYFLPGTTIVSIDSLTQVTLSTNALATNAAAVLPFRSSTLLRANTPNSNNNEYEDFADLLQYIGSPSIYDSTPAFANNYGGPPGEDLTSRASGLDLLTQWRYEERNFHLMADSEPTTLSWNPMTTTLVASGPLRLMTSHRDSYWIIPTISAVIPANSALYYVLDRTLSTSPITLTPTIAPLGSIPNDRDNRQIWVAAFCLGTTLWWRGGGGSRFPGTGGITGTYFVDGTSKSLLDYLGAPDYNSSNPNYTNNFAGNVGESLTVRASKTDTLIKRLFEYSNLGTYFSDSGFVSVEPGPSSTYTVALSGTFYMAFPHVAGRITASTASWNLADGELVYFELDQGILAGSDIPIASSAVVSVGSLPLPDAYPLTKKYFVFARRSGTSVYLWDDSELPVGGRYPVPVGRSVVRTTAAVTLADNTVWDGTNFLWEGLKLAVATGIPLTRNSFADQIVASPGLTNLAEGEGLLVTHTWNTGSSQNVTVEKVALPLSQVQNQNQFLWVQRRSNNIIFTE